jgi:ribosomal protein S17
MGTVTENTNSRRLKKELVGVVISDKMDKTVIVKTNRRVVHIQFTKK